MTSAEESLHHAADLLLALQQRFADAHDQVIFVSPDRELKAAAQVSGLVVTGPAEQEAATPSTPGDNR